MEAAEIGTALLLDAGLAEIEEMLSSSSKTKASFSAGTAKKKGATIDYSGYVLFSSQGGSSQTWKCDPTTVARAPEKATNYQRKTVGAKC